MNSQFLHVGMTVADIDRTIEFYTKYFNFTLEHKAVFSEKFIGSKKQLYKMPDGAFSDFCFLKSPDGYIIEAFQFHPQVPFEEAVWNRPGYTHICLRVDDIFEAYEKMKADGVEFYFAPEERGGPNAHWVFLKDPDGNMIELQDEKAHEA